MAPAGVSVVENRRTSIAEIVYLPLEFLILCLANIERKVPTTKPVPTPKARRGTPDDLLCRPLTWV
jgi:hypothetical protein